MYGQKLANHKVLRQVKSFVKFLFEFRFLNYGFSLYPSESMACAPNGAQILLITYGYLRAIFTKLLHIRIFKFKVDRLQIILVAKKIYIYVSQLFISRMPKMHAIPQLVSAVQQEK